MAPSGWQNLPGSENGNASAMIYCSWHINYNTAHESGTPCLSKFIHITSLTWRSHLWALWGRRREGSVMATTKPPRETLHSWTCFLLRARRHACMHQYIVALILTHTNRDPHVGCVVFLLWISLFLSGCPFVSIVHLSSICSAFSHISVGLFCVSLYSQHVPQLLPENTPDSIKNANL